MVEQDNALEFYSANNIKLPSGLWSGRLYLPSADLRPPSPSPSPPAATGDSFNEDEWEDIVSPLYTPNSLFSSMASPTSLYANSSGYQSDLSLSLCSSIMQQQQRTVHSLNFTSSCRQPSNSRPHTAPSSGRKQWSAGGGASFSPTCSCHFRVIPSQSLNLPSHSSSSYSPKPDSALDKCCEDCKDSCRLAEELLNL